MTAEIWLLALLVVVIIAGIVGVVLAGLSRDIPDDEMPERWRQENERDRGKKP